MTRTLMVVMVIVLLAATAACSSDDSDSRVTFEAQWQCDIQRMTFDDLAEIEAARTAALEDWGLSEADYEAFRTELGQSNDLRMAVTTAYDEYCRD